MEWITRLDAGTLLFIQDTIRNPVLTPVFMVITVLGNGAAVWILMWAWRLQERHGRQH